MTKRILAVGVLLGMVCATTSYADDDMMLAQNVVSGAAVAAPITGGPKQVVGTNAGGEAQMTTVDQNGQLSAAGVSGTGQVKN